MKMLSALVLGMGLVVCTPANAAKTMATVQVKIVGLKTQEGGIAFALYNKDNADSFPMKAENAAQRKYIKLSDFKGSILFEKVPFGTYAVSAYHDLDSDQELDSNFIGIPKEPVGSSNNAKGSMGPPKFKDAAFEVQNKKTVIEFNLE